MLSQPHASEGAVVYAGGCPPRTGRSRRVPLSAKKVEAIAIRCPVSRSKIKACRKETFTACGEESTYQGTYSRVQYRSTNEIPLIAQDAKVNVLKLATPPTLPEEWSDRNGSDVPLFWCESKPIAFFLALIDDWHVQAIFDCTPGTGACLEAALTRGVAYHGCCRNLSLCVHYLCCEASLALSIQAFLNSLCQLSVGMCKLILQVRNVVLPTGSCQRVSFVDFETNALKCISEK